MKSTMVSNLVKGLEEENIDSLRLKYKSGNWSPDEIWFVGASNIYEGNYNEAIELFENCLSKDDNHLPSHFFLAISYDLNKNYTKAISKYNYFKDLSENPMTSMALFFKEAAIRAKESE